VSKHHNAETAGREVKQLMREQAAIERRRDNKLSSMPKGEGGYEDRLAVIKEAKAETASIRREAEQVTGDLLIHGG